MKKLILYSFTSVLFLACGTAKRSTAEKGSTPFDKQGHRGCRGLMPENTIPAMLKAIDLGVTTLEMDVVISKDNQVVVSHDLYFNENITTTPEGNYLTKAEAGKRLLYTMPYDSIARYDVGGKPHPDFPRQQKLSVHKPLLAALLDATESYARKKGRAIYYNIEIKSKPESDGKKHPPVKEFAGLVMKLISEKGIVPRTTIQSFDPRALQVVHQNFPDLSTSLLVEATEKRPLQEQLTELGYIPAVYSPHFSLVTPELVRQCHEIKIRVIPWTVNTTDEMKKLVAQGVDGVISDFPDLYSQL